MIMSLLNPFVAAGLMFPVLCGVVFVVAWVATRIQGGAK
jgi:hypothetical protein